MNHTPTPWEACEPDDYSDTLNGGSVVLGDDKRVAVFYDKKDADAAVSAMNAHEDLVKALLSRCECPHCLIHEQKACEGCKCGHESRVKKALAKAGVKP